MSAVLICKWTLSHNDDDDDDNGCENKNAWILRIKRQSANPGLLGKWPFK